MCKAKCVKTFFFFFNINLQSETAKENVGAIQWAGELGVHMWGNRVGECGGTAVGEPRSTVFSKFSKNPISYA